jgi:phosphate transport system substrate-binding protein
VHATPPDAVAIAAALRFFNWAFDRGGQAATGPDFVPRPALDIRQGRTTWRNEIKALRPIWGAAASHRK